MTSPLRGIDDEMTEVMRAQPASSMRHRREVMRPQGASCEQQVMRY
ncbi:MAG: hypothetical protein KGL73_15200 [Burkholderiales bacterium]|nr:hypothetical protein [Burkholderiales bacterium]